MKYTVEDVDGDEVLVYDYADLVVVAISTDAFEDPVIVNLAPDVVTDLVWALNRARAEAEKAAQINKNKVNA